MAKGKRRASKKSKKAAEWLTRREVISGAVGLGVALAVKYSPDRVQTVRIEQPVPINRSFSDGLQLQDETQVQTLRQTAPVIIRWTLPNGIVTNAAG